MNRAWAIILPSAALALASCNSDSEPSGQVAATVDGEEITITEVNTELGGASANDPDQQKALANRALDAIVARTIAANEATARGLDQTPEGAMMLEKARQLALVELLQRDLRGQVPAVSDEEAERYVDDNRELFADRTIAVVEQLAVPEASRELIMQTEPIDTLEGIRQLLDSQGIEYRTSMGTVDSLTLTNEMGRQISQLAVGDVYVIPQGGGMRVNAIRSRNPFPISREDAVALAKEMLSGQRVQQQTSDALNQIIATGRQNVTYAADFSAPDSPDAAGAAAADGDAEAATQ